MKPASFDYHAPTTVDEALALLEAHGERVLHVTWAQAIRRPGETLARIRAAGAPSSDRVSISSA